MSRRTLAVVLLALVLAASCSPRRSDETTTTSVASRLTTTTTATTSSEMPTALPVPVVAALGDSQLFEAEEELRRALPDAVLQTQAVIGLTVGEGHFGLARLLAASPGALAVVLGTNEVSDGTFTGEELAELDALAAQAAEAAEAPCLHWVDVPTATPSASFNQAAEAFNAALLRASIEHGFLVVRWSFAFASHPEWLRPDGIHYSEEGQAALAESIATAVRSCLGAAPIS